jgi:hypothetical protein
MSGAVQSESEPQTVVSSFAAHALRHEVAMKRFTLMPTVGVPQQTPPEH